MPYKLAPIPYRFVNSYQCPSCYYLWMDEWNSTCDDVCPACGARHISPYQSDEIDPDLGEILA